MSYSPVVERFPNSPEPTYLSPYRAELDTTRADWVVQGCHGPLWTLFRTVPESFERYLCIHHHGFHWPDDCLGEDFNRLTPEEQQARMLPLRWSELAQTLGKEAGSVLTWPELVPQLSMDAPRPSGIVPPREGELPLYVLDTVFDHLGHYSGADQECICAIWEGFTNREVRYLERAGAATIEGMGQQSHLLMSAPLHVVWEQWRSVLIHADESLGLVPQAVWPTSREWFFAVPFEMHSSFLGGPGELLRRIESSESMDVYEAKTEGTYL